MVVFFDFYIDVLEIKNDFIKIIHMLPYIFTFIYVYCVQWLLQIQSQCAFESTSAIFFLSVVASTAYGFIAVNKLWCTKRSFIWFSTDWNCWCLWIFQDRISSLPLPKNLALYTTCCGLFNNQIKSHTPPTTKFPQKTIRFNLERSLSGLTEYVSEYQTLWTFTHEKNSAQKITWFGQLTYVHAANKRVSLLI